MTRDVLREAIFFADRARFGARFVFDDHSKYAMSIIANVLLYFNFKTIEMGENKCLLEKIKK
jgi:hypothetical protein